MHPIVRRILSEPLLHFLVLGAGLFLILRPSAEEAREADPQRIHLTQGDVEHLAITFASTWNRPPTKVELLGLVRDRVRDEVYAREARALGLDRDDPIVRRRLRQKVEFVMEDLGALAEPTEAQLEAHLRSRADTYRVAPQLTFRQVYVNPEKHGPDPAREATALLGRLREAGAGADPAGFGDASLLDSSFDGVSTQDVAKRFGDAFAARLTELPLGSWEGPVESAFGTHLVLVASRTPTRVPPLAEVRDAVRRDWANERRIQANERHYRELFRRYDVTVEGLDEPLEPDLPAAPGPAR